MSKQVDPVAAGASLDENVIAVLPPNCEILSVTPSGRSLWVATLRIEVRLKDGGSGIFFKKGAIGDVGYNMMRGCFEAETALYEFIPDHVPRPIAFGTHKLRPDTHFYMCQFVDMLDDVPDPRGWATAVTNLHSRSMGKSPCGQFGFSVDTHLANVPVDNTWASSWEVFFAQQMRSLLNKEETLHGPDAEYKQLKDEFFDIVIPRFLRPLETEGRSITPCLVHSDLWPGNIKPSLDSDAVCMFDSCAYWGHNEADLAICRNPRYRLGKSYINEYLKQIPASEPTEDFEGRNAVYAMKYHVLLSIMYFKDKRFHKIAIEEMESLVRIVRNERT